jgi:hypothetical protein
MNKISKTDETDQTLEAVALTPCIEFAFWTMIVLFALLYWMNDPAVSTDQLVVRTTLVVLATGGGFLLRITTWSHKRSNRSPRASESDEAAVGHD